MKKYFLLAAFVLAFLVFGPSELVSDLVMAGACISAVMLFLALIALGIFMVELLFHMLFCKDEKEEDSLAK